MSELIVDKPAAEQPTVAVMNQVPQSGPRAESPLHHADLPTIARKGPQQGGVYLEELKLLGHLVLRGSTDNQAFMAGAEKVLGVALPGSLQSAEKGELSVRWLAPDEWLVIVPGARAFDLERELRAAMSGHYAIVNVSGGQTVLSLSGPKARDVLMKTTPYDVHDRNFPVGKVVTSVFAKTQAVIRRTGEQSWELVIRRSFADYAWLWLQDASAEYGLVVRS
ncbi:sarcosine oxidase subunit gamma [Marinobacterium arenosum]|uniref:sarcosine oxidase subunit gamma n=1 Tax=Marinobacterium arenosum TaxID=2862496 RepID=UPI001C93CEB2|nr:sarcosine oxidase subunit gamma family protein [Marinobacterium arenosum]MBY4678756.1 sarcosine oxidase subunit gamma family protein [Marinobacterium arenosum]